MKDSNFLRQINSLEERNGVAEAIYLLEEKLKTGKTGKMEMLRLVFLYWFVGFNSQGIVPGAKDVRARLLEIIDRTLREYPSDSDCRWIIGYVLTQLDESVRNRGMNLLDGALNLAPADPIPRLIKQIVSSKSTGDTPDEIWQRFNDWGMMGEYFSYLLISRHK